MKYFRKLLSILVLAVLATSACAQTPNPDTDDQLHSDLSLQYLVHLPNSSHDHPPVIILLHGMGSNEEDLYSLRTALPANFAVVSARAPYVLGEGSYEWFEDATVNNRLDGDPQQLAASRARISRFVDELIKKYGFDKNQIYLVGFSQGATMSYQVALTEPAKIKGIGVMIKPYPNLSHLRVFISHGGADSRIPVDYARDADQRLKRLGLTPELHIYPTMAHEINRDALRDLVNWLSGS
jgi:phospholipase/carboxylesterase